MPNTEFWDWRQWARSSSVLLAAVCAFAVGPAACDRGAPGYYGTVEPKHGPRVVWTNNSTEPEWLDPSKASDSASGTIVSNIFEGLVEPHPKTLTPMPAIAETWAISDQGRVYTFYLRPTMWSDGVPLTAHDFEFSWKRLLDPSTGSKYATFLWEIRHARPFSRRALWVTASGQAKATPNELCARVRHRLQGRVQIDEIELSEHPPGVFVYLGGDGVTEAQRTAALATLHSLESVTAHLTNETLVGVEALDARTLRVTLEDPVPYFLDKLSFYVTLPVPRHLFDRLARQHIPEQLWTRPEHIVSNGAFTLGEWKFRQHIWLDKNPRYWDHATVELDRVKLLMVESSNTALNLYEAGEIDWIGQNGTLPAEFLDHLSQFEDFTQGPWLGTYFFWVNTERPPLDDPKVRRALSLAIDREAIVRFVTRGGQIPTATLVPDGLAGYWAPHRSLFSPQRARKLLGEAGYPEGSGLPAISLIYNTSEGHKQIAEALQQMWKTHLGISVSLENQEWKVYLKNLGLENFQIARMGWIGDYADPYTFLEILLGNSGNNHSNWQSSRYDDLLYQANATLEHEARLRLLRQAEELMLDAQPLIPLYVYTRSDMVKPYVHGIWSNIQNHHPLKWVSVDARDRGRLPPRRQQPDSPPPLRTPRPFTEGR